MDVLASLGKEKGHTFLKGRSGEVKLEGSAGKQKGKKPHLMIWVFLVYV